MATTKNRYTEKSCPSGEGFYGTLEDSRDSDYSKYLGFMFIDQFYNEQV